MPMVMAKVTTAGATVSAGRLRRPVHPLAWWAWAACLAVAAMQTSNPNPFLLLLIGAVACFVAASCRGNAPWSGSLALFLRIGLVVVVIRVAIEILFGQRGVPGHVLFTLPRVPLPSWAAAVSIGGAVTLESILTALVLGLQIAVILVSFGAANSLVSPYRLLRCLPTVLYETGVAVTVALSFTPELIETISAVRQARRLRGIPTNGLRGLRGIAVPVLEGALERSLQLATSMDARGYGRRNATSRRAHVLAVGATALGLLLAAIGIYGVIDTGSLFGLGLPIVAVAVVLCALGLTLGGRLTERTRYRPDRWGAQESAILASGLAAVGSMALAHALEVPGMVVSFVPLAVPPLPLLPVAGVLVAALPAFIAPVRRATPAPGLSELGAAVA
jgi:energy-coupling factor transport system permease protein